MEPGCRLDVAVKLMDEFSARTGLTDIATKPRRYLWTDAFAVCNFLELYRQTGDNRFRQLALRLVEQVHHILGRHRGDDSRSGWLSGLNEEEGEKHPTAGGLRIGKEMPERRPESPYSPELEWERDGQYFHYLTKWMHALNQVSQEEGDPLYHRWAVELVAGIHPRFTYSGPADGAKRMFWKMSIDLSRPQVPSMGMHDPLDGFLTYLELRAGSKQDRMPELDFAIADMAEMCRGRDWSTDDPLGLGGLLCDLLRTGQLMVQHGLKLDDLFMDLLNASTLGFTQFMAGPTLEYPPKYRLAFRELGLAIGLHAVDRLLVLKKGNPHLFGPKEKLESGINRLLAHNELREKIESFWLKIENRETITWLEHEDINSVMLATSLVPDTFLATEMVIGKV